MPKTQWTRIKLISAALSKVGKGPISNTSELNDFGNFAELIYDVSVPAVLAAANWTFANAVRELNLLTLTPPLDKWKYAFQLPADYLTANGVDPNTPYTIYEDKLYANIQPLSLDYRFFPDESRFTPAFVAYLVAYLAVQYGPASDIDQDLMQTLEGELKLWSGTAIATSSKAHPNKSIEDSPFINVRGGGNW